MDDTRLVNIARDKTLYTEKVGHPRKDGVTAMKIINLLYKMT